MNFMDLYNQLVEWWTSNGTIEMLFQILYPVIAVIGVKVVKNATTEKALAKIKEKEAIKNVDTIVSSLTLELAKIAKENTSGNKEVSDNIEVLTQMIIGVIKNSRINADEKEKYILMANKILAPKDKPIEVKVIEVECPKEVTMEDFSNDKELIKEVEKETSSSYLEEVMSD